LTEKPRPPILFHMNCSDMDNPVYRIVLVDDHEIFRLGLKTVIESDASLQVTGEAGNGYDLLSLLQQAEADLAIIDLHLPQMDGYTLLDNLSQHYPRLKRLVVSMHVNRQSVKDAMVKRIDGFINKEDAADSVLESIHAIRQGKKFFSGDILDLILSNYDEMFVLQRTMKALTRRELEVARLVAAGHTSKGIATQLNISVHTVQFHRSNVMSKLGLKNIADLVGFMLKGDI